MTLPQRKSPRLRSFDYRQNGAYFITLCTRNQHCVLSSIAVGEGLAPPVLTLLPFGKIAESQLLAVESRFPTVTIDKYVIMPNHIHILLRLANPGGASPSPTVSDVIGAFKSLTTRMCHIGEPLFQRSFHDHIIRSEQEYAMIRNYIIHNPASWVKDRFYCSEPYV